MRRFWVMGLGIALLCVLAPTVATAVPDARRTPVSWMLARTKMARAKDGLAPSPPDLGTVSEASWRIAEARYAAIHALIDGLSLQVAADPDADVTVVREQALDAVMALLR